MKAYAIIFCICLILNILLALITLYSLITKSLNNTLKTGLYFYLLLLLLASFAGTLLNDSGHYGWSLTLLLIPVILAIIAVLLTYIALKGLSKRLF